MQFAKQNPLFRGRSRLAGVGETGLQDVKWKTGEKFVNYRSFRRWTVAREVDILLPAATDYYLFSRTLFLNLCVIGCVSPALSTDIPPHRMSGPFLPLFPWFPRERYPVLVTRLTTRNLFKQRGPRGFCDGPATLTRALSRITWA